MEKKPRPANVSGVTRMVMTGCGKLYVTVNHDEEGNTFEVFARMGKAGGCASSQTEAVGRLISLILRSGGSPDRIVNQLRGIHCYHISGDTKSCADAIAFVIEQYIQKEQ